MKQRLISAFVAIIILVVVLRFYITFALNVSIALIAGVAVYEMLSAAGLTKYHVMSAACILLAVFLPVSSLFFSKLAITGMIYLFIVIILCLMLRLYNNISYQLMAFSIFAALGISASFTTLVLIRDSHRNILGLLYILLALGSGWFADTGAYFTGMALGRHKLAPLISPKKTVEGAVGGIIINMICCSLTAYIFTLTAEKLNYMHLHVNYPLLIIISAAAAAAGILGDLSASIIKRQCKIKDFGNIMPGHGGVMDRFDSVLLTAPLIYLVSSAFNIVEII